jgi:hypothetical protein
MVQVSFHFSVGVQHLESLLLLGIHHKSVYLQLLMLYLLLDYYHYQNISKKEENICCHGLLRVIYFNRADNLGVVSKNHDVFIGHLKGTLKK